MASVWVEFRTFLSGVGVGILFVALALGLYLESRDQPAPFSCPYGLQIVIGNQVLLHSSNSPQAHYCNIVPAP